MRQILDDLRNRVRLMVGRGVLSLVNDAKAIQTAQVQLLAGETQDNCERIQQYGFSSMPHAGAEAVLVFPGGLRDHGLIIAVDDRRYRMKSLASGEVALYDDLGRSVLISRDGIVVDGKDHLVTVKSVVKVRIEAPSLECTGEIKDRCDTDGKTMEAMRNAYNGHVHFPLVTSPDPSMG